MAPRAQSEALGTLLLVAVVAIVVTTLTAATILDQRSVDDPNVDIATNVTDRRVVLNHTGGDPLEVGRLSVTVRDDGGGEFVIRGLGGVGDQFDPGEGWSADHGLSVSPGDRVRVVVVHANRTVLVDAERRVYPD